MYVHKDGHLKQHYLMQAPQSTSEKKKTDWKLKRSSNILLPFVVVVARVNPNSCKLAQLDQLQ